MNDKSRHSETRFLSTTKERDLLNAPPNIGALVQRFLATRKSERTRLTYARALELFVEQAQGAGLNSLSGDAIIAFSKQQNDATDRGDISADSCRGRLKSVASFFSWLYKFDLSPLKPALVSTELMDIPPARKLSPRDVLTPAEARDLIDAAILDRDRILIRILLDAGLRISEALGLRANDVYSDDENYYLHVENGKGNKSRDVTIGIDLYDDIISFVVENGDEPGSRARIISMHPATAWRLVKRLAKVAGIDKDISPHSLRHTHANILARTGDYPIEIIAERLGHANLDTAKIYTRPADLARMVTPVMPWSREAK